MFFQMTQHVWDIFMVAVVGFALWKGGWPERTVALAAVVASLTSAVVENRRAWLDPQWAVLGVDVLFLLLLVGLALKVSRTWLLFAAAFQLLGVVIHAAMMADRKVNPWAYITGGVIWSYLVMAALAFGAWRHGRATRAADS